MLALMSGAPRVARRGMTNRIYRRILVLALVVHPLVVLAAGMGGHSPDLRIRHVPVKVVNNSSQTYEFGLSVLGLQEGPKFTPFLAIAIDSSAQQSNQWMAVWNLGIGGTSVGSRVKALFPNVWGTLGDGGSDRGEDDSRDLPKPFLTWNSKKSRSWAELRWTFAETATSVLGLFNPGRFLFGNYAGYRDDSAERHFHQTYALLRLYEEVRAVQPSQDNLSMEGLTDLKYHLIIGRSGFGVFAGNEDSVSVVSQFESSLRESIGLASCYAHDEANQLFLGFEEVPYGISGRPPVARAGLLSIRKSDLPAQLPDWPANNLFDLSCSPYSDPLVLDLMARSPDEPIPLGIYVFGSDLRTKPVLVVDFFHPGNPKTRKATGTFKVALDNFLSVKGIPWIGRILKKSLEYGIEKKDVSYFNPYSEALGVETARLFAKMGWNFDPDLNHILLKSIESRIGNPMVESGTRERQNIEDNYRNLLAEDGARLGLLLRTLLENRIRKTLELGNKAVFAEDLRRYQSLREHEMALRTVITVNSEPHMPSLSWDKIIHAWQILDREKRPGDGLELERLIAKVKLLYPDAVPLSQRVAVTRLLGPEAHVARAFNVAAETRQ